MKTGNRITYNDLFEMFDEASAELSHALHENRRLESEQYFLEGFISFKGLTEEYEYFKTHAHPKEDPNDPFPPLVL